MNIDFGRVMTAMITPFDEAGKVDYDEACRFAEFLVNNGSDSILLTGTTGESPTLTHEEEIQLYTAVGKHLKGKAKIIAGTGSNSTETAVWHTKAAEKLGVDASLQVTPYYNKPSQEGLYQHFKTVAENTSLPIILYNVPGRTGTLIQPETIARLSKIDNIVAVKEASGSVDQVQKVRELTAPDFLIYSGDDVLTLDFMAKGAYGVISVGSHLVGNKIQEMVSLYAAGKVEEAKVLNELLKPLFEVLFITSNPTPVKYAVNQIGFKVGIPRLPLVEPTDAEKKAIESVMQKLQLLEKV